jgi:hypothetical protein
MEFIPTYIILDGPILFWNRFNYIDAINTKENPIFGRT